jgi:hypothetical protein
MKKYLPAIAIVIIIMLISLIPDGQGLLKDLPEGIKEVIGFIIFYFFLIWIIRGEVRDAIKEMKD